VAQETNIHWTPTTIPLILSQAQHTTPHLALATSSSNEETANWYKPGSTFVLAMNQWTSWIIARGADTPLGQWSYLELVGKLSKHQVIILAYQVCHQKFDMASDMALLQQIASRIANPNPRKIFLTDLINHIKQWRAMQKEVLLCMDTNNSIDDPKAKISQLFLETDLTDLHHHHYPSLKKPNRSNGQQPTHSQHPTLCMDVPLQWSAYHQRQP